mmetsp:Transcript_15483/g.33689  ORF Transcript_15483/g.33689 Transcript_15483/m.33689 type:complete len:220 (+) Transcript_15483:2534-3193(+)
MLYSLNVGEQIAIYCEAHIDDNSTNTKKGTMKDQTTASFFALNTNKHLLSKIATRATADTATIKNDGRWFNIFDICQMMIRRLNVSVAVLFTGRKSPPLYLIGDVGKTVASVVIGHYIDLEQTRQLLEVFIEHPKIFCIAMTVKYCKFPGEAINEEGRDATAKPSFQPEYFGTGNRGWFLWWLEEKRADYVPHAGLLLSGVRSIPVSDEGNERLSRFRR